MWTSSQKGQQFSEWSCSVLGSSCFQSTQTKFLIHLMAPIPALTFLQIISAWQSQLRFSSISTSRHLCVQVRGANEHHTFDCRRRFSSLQASVSPQVRPESREESTKEEWRGRWREEKKNFPLFPSSTPPPPTFLFFPLSLSNFRAITHRKKTFATQASVPLTNMIEIRGYLYHKFVGTVRNYEDISSLFSHCL